MQRMHDAPIGIAHSPCLAPQAKNVLGGPLQCCCKDPVTGFTRDGYCKVVSGDTGVHAVCAQVRCVLHAMCTVRRSRGRLLQTA